MKSKYAELVDTKKLVVKEGEFPRVNGSPIIKVTHVGICGSDIHIWERNPITPQYQGLIMGHEYSGVVVEPGNSDLKVGDRVAGYTQNIYNEPCGCCEACLKGDFDNCTNRVVKVSIGNELEHRGAYSEYLTWYPHAFFKLPDHVSNEEAALLEPSSVALHAIRLSEIQPGQSVLIISGGIIGLCIAEWARIFGAGKIIISEIDQKKIELIKDLTPADEVVKSDDPAVEEKFKREFPDGFDLVFDCVTNQITMNQGIQLVRRGGTLVMVGVPQKRLDFDSREVVLRQKRIQGSKGHLPVEFEMSLRSFASGNLNLKKYITGRYPLEEIQKAFEVSKDYSRSIKVLIEIK